MEPYTAPPTPIGYLNGKPVYPIAGGARTLSVVLTAAVGQYQAGMKAATASTAALGASVTRTAQQNKAAFTMIGGAAVLAGGMVLRSLVNMGREAREFDTSLMKLQTQIGLTTGEVNDFVGANGSALLAMSHTGKGALELADAAFFVASAGFRGAEALDILEKSAMASAMGLGETKVVADLVTSAMTAYGSEVLNAESATNILIATVKEGKAEAEDLAGAMGQVLPIASAMGVSFADVGAAIAAMTRTGTNARTATIQLRQILLDIIRPTGRAEEAMRSYGLSSQMLTRTIREEGLLAALLLLHDATGGTAEALTEVTGNARSAMGIMDLLGANFEDNIGIFERMRDTTGALSDAWDVFAGSSQAAADRFSASWENVKITIGQAVLPVLTLLNMGGEALLGTFLALPPVVRNATVALTALSAVFAVLGGSMLMVLPHVAAMQANLAALRVTLQGTAGGLAALRFASLGAKAGLIGLAAALGALVAMGIDRTNAKLQEGGSNFRWYGEAVQFVVGTVNPLARVLQIYRHVAGGAKEDTDGLAESFEGAGGSAEEMHSLITQAMDEIDEAMEQARQAAMDLAVSFTALERDPEKSLAVFRTSLATNLDFIRQWREDLLQIADVAPDVAAHFLRIGPESAEAARQAAQMITDTGGLGSLPEEVRAVVEESKRLADLEFNTWPQNFSEEARQAAAAFVLSMQSGLGEVRAAIGKSGAAQAIRDFAKEFITLANTSDIQLGRVELGLLDVATRTNDPVLAMGALDAAIALVERRSLEIDLSDFDAKTAKAFQTLNDYGALAPIAQLLADGDPASREIADIIAKLVGLTTADWRAVVRALSEGTGQVARELDHLARPRTATIHVQYRAPSAADEAAMRAQVSQQFARLAAPPPPPRPRQPGSVINVHSGGYIPAMHMGGIRADERLILAQSGEFMMQRSAVNQFGLDFMQAINAGRVPTGSGGPDLSGLLEALQRMSQDKVIQVNLMIDPSARSGKMEAAIVDVIRHGARVQSGGDVQAFLGAST